MTTQTPSTPTTTTTTDLVHAWFDLWNGATDLAAEILTPDFRIWLAGTATWDDVHGPDAFAARVTDHRADKPDLVFAQHGERVVAGDRAAVTWTATRAVDGVEQRLGGIDVLEVREGRIHRVWSATGERDFTC